MADVVRPVVRLLGDEPPPAGPPGAERRRVPHRWVAPALLLAFSVGAGTGQLRSSPPEQALELTLRPSQQTPSVGPGDVGVQLLVDAVGAARAEVLSVTARDVDLSWAGPAPLALDRAGALWVAGTFTCGPAGASLRVPDLLVVDVALRTPDGARTVTQELDVRGYGLPAALDGACGVVPAESAVWAVVGPPLEVGGRLYAPVQLDNASGSPHRVLAVTSADARVVLHHGGAPVTAPVDLLGIETPGVDRVAERQGFALLVDAPCSALADLDGPVRVQVAFDAGPGTLRHLSEAAMDVSTVLPCP